MPESRPPIDLQGLSLAELQKLIDERRLPPVDQWNPERCGHSGMRIARDGTWYHEGSPIGRPAMVRLFSTVLRREPDGRHVLVTPVEKLDIDVEVDRLPGDRHASRGRGSRPAHRLRARQRRRPSSSAADHPLRIVDTEHGPSPRLLVRHGLEAELTRPVYYELAELALGEATSRRRLERRRLLPAGGGDERSPTRLRARSSRASEPMLLPGDLPELRRASACRPRCSSRSPIARTRSDPDRPPRAYAHPCRADRLSRRPDRPRRRRDRRRAARGARGNPARPRMQSNSSARSSPIGPSPAMSSRR